MSSSLPCVVAILPRFSPSAWIHIVKPLVALHEAGRITAWITLEGLASPRDVERADVAVFSRNVSPDRAGLLRAAVRGSVPVIYDLDDNFFEISPDSAVGRVCAQPRHLAMLEEYLAAASLVRVYSRPLLARAAELNANVALVVSAVDLSQIRPGDCPDFRRWTHTPSRQSQSGENGTVPFNAAEKAAGYPLGANRLPIRLVYATSRLDDSLGEIFMPALRRLLDERGRQVEVHIWGPRPPRDLAGVRHHAMIHDYDGYLRRFSAAGFQIGLAPLLDDVFHRSKTNTKYREYGACRIAGIYSDVDVYSSCVRHGETGLLVSDSAADWYRAMRQLIDDDALRQRIQRQARADVEQRYSQEHFEQVFLEQIQRLADGRQAFAAPPPGSSPEIRLKPVRQASNFRLKPVLQTIALAVGHVRRNGPARSWNTLRWLASSGWNLARLQRRLRRLRAAKP